MSIRDELTPEQTNELAGDFLAFMVFNTIHRTNNPNRARERMKMMTGEQLRRFLETVGILAEMAEEVQQERTND